MVTCKGFCEILEQILFIHVPLMLNYKGKNQYRNSCMKILALIGIIVIIIFTIISFTKLGELIEIVETTMANDQKQTQLEGELDFEFQLGVSDTVG